VQGTNPDQRQQSLKVSTKYNGPKRSIPNKEIEIVRADRVAIGLGYCDS